jgi:peptide/nickel transport system substrate-binding protein
MPEEAVVTLCYGLFKGARRGQTLKEKVRSAIFLFMLCLFVSCSTNQQVNVSTPTPSSTSLNTIATNTPSIVQNRFLVYGSDGEPDTLDCANTTANTSVIVTLQMLETLVTFEPGTLNLAPGLAEKWEPNDDSSEWTFTLHRGITFHDGTPLNAEAVVFNFERMADPAFPYGFRDETSPFLVFTSIFGGFVDDEDTMWESATALDEHTVQFKLKQPVPLFPHYLAAPYFGISSPQAIKTYEADYGNSEVGAIGSGPFAFRSWEPGAEIVLERYAGYWGEQAKMPGITFKFIGDAAERLQALQTGQIDFTVNLAADAGAVIEQNSELELVTTVPFSLGYLAMNITISPLDDRRVRQAIAYAIDKEAIVNQFYKDVGDVAVGFLPDVLAWARPDDTVTYPYNPQKARELLAAAGYPDGLDTMVLPNGREIPLELWYMPVSRPYYPTPRPVADMLVNSLAEAGIDVTLKTEEWTSYLQNWQAGTRYGLVMIGWTGDYADPNNFLYPHFGPGNVAGYVNEDVFALLKSASTARTQQEAAGFFQQAGRILDQDMVRIPIVQTSPLYARKQTLQGWTPGPGGTTSFASILLVEKEA